MTTSIAIASSSTTRLSGSPPRVSSKQVFLKNCGSVPLKAARIHSVQVCTGTPNSGPSFVRTPRGSLFSPQGSKDSRNSDKAEAASPPPITFSTFSVSLLLTGAFLFSPLSFTPPAQAQTSPSEYLEPAAQDLRNEELGGSTVRERKAFEDEQQRGRTDAELGEKLKSLKNPQQAAPVGEDSGGAIAQPGSETSGKSS